MTAGHLDLNPHCHGIGKPVASPPWPEAHRTERETIEHVMTNRYRRGSGTCRLKGMAMSGMVD